MADATLRQGRIRVLNMLHVMGRGGVETWLMHVMRNIDRERFHLDFLVRDPEPGAHDAEIRELGGRIFRVDHRAGLRRYAAGVTDVLQAHGPYDVVHSHLGFFTGINLAIASRNRTRSRIAHCHNTGSSRYESRPILQAAYRSALRPLVRRYATYGWACSAAAAAFLFGPRWQRDRRWHVLYFGFDFAPFAKIRDRTEAREALGISPGRVVIGHIGRFNPQKNHSFLLSVFARLVSSGLDAHLLLVGGGSLEGQIRRQVADLGLSERVSMPGEMDNVALALGAMDIKLLPSRYEGLGIVALESQAAAVPILLSDVVPPEVEVVPGLVHRLPLEAGVDAWAERVHAIIHRPSASRDRALQIVGASQFTISRNLEELCRVYSIGSG